MRGVREGAGNNQKESKLKKKGVLCEENREENPRTISMGAAVWN